jgi:hypothetical protein
MSTPENIRRDAINTLNLQGFNHQFQLIIHLILKIANQRLRSVRTLLQGVHHSVQITQFDFQTDLSRRGKRDLLRLCHQVLSINPKD